MNTVTFPNVAEAPISWESGVHKGVPDEYKAIWCT